MSTTALDPAALTPESLSAGLLSGLGAREDLARGFGPAASPLPGAVSLLGGAPSAGDLPLEALHRAAEAPTPDPAAHRAAAGGDRAP